MINGSNLKVFAHSNLILSPIYNGFTQQSMQISSQCGLPAWFEHSICGSAWYALSRVLYSAGHIKLVGFYLLHFKVLFYFNCWWGGGPHIKIDEYPPSNFLKLHFLLKPHSPICLCSFSGHSLLSTITRVQGGARSDSHPWQCGL